MPHEEAFSSTTLHQHNTPQPAILALKREQERRRELETFIRWEDELFSNPNISGNHKLEIRATRRAVQRAQTRDEAGRARINLKTIAEQIGISPDTMSRGLKTLKACGVIADHNFKHEVQENGELWTRHYIALNDDMLQQPREIKPPTPRNHGGNRYRCEHCGSDRVRIKKRITLICTCCQHESLLEESEREQESEEPTSAEQDDEPKNFDEPDRNLQDNLKPVSPPYGPDGTTNLETSLQMGQDDLRAAAALLLALAGEHDEHIEMSRRGAKKYYTVPRPLKTSDLVDHLRGGQARGASCCYPDGRTRGLCFDADDQQRWERLERTARQLADAGYAPILEKSPADRGGHLWVIYDDLVDAEAARHHVCSMAPELADLVEYWPGPQDAPRWNRVRLPGGKYVRPGVNAWCQLVSVATGEISTDGHGAAQFLLANQTPAAIVPAIHDQDDQARACSSEEQEPSGPPARQSVGQMSGSGALPNSNEPCNEKSNVPPGHIDAHWHERYHTAEGARLWFAWTPAQLSAWWNERHDLDELLPSERNGYGLASWRGERTASVAKRGDQWADFGAAARQRDGSPDSGDALELQQRLTGAPKADVMREAARELLQVARQELEQAARAGHPIPAWLEEIITDAGRQHYARVASAAGHLGDTTPIRVTKWTVTKSDQAEPNTGGLTGFSQGEASTSKSNGLPGDNTAKNPSVAVPFELEGWVREEL